MNNKEKAKRLIQLELPSQRELAKRAGVSESAMSRKLKGKRGLNPKQAKVIVDSYQKFANSVLDALETETGWEVHPVRVIEYGEYEICDPMDADAYVLTNQEGQAIAVFGLAYEHLAKRLT